MATYETSDESVGVVIGSGAGGGTLANELCQKGVNVVLLEAGKRQSTATYVNDEWASFGQLAWTDKRTTSGTWRVARDFPNLPAWTCKTVGGTTTHWAGASLRIQRHEFKALTTYGRIEGANLLDWPLTYEELAPYYDKAEDQRQKARVVCVACNSIETARLLLNSQSSQHPNGLANSSGQVGRNYQRHMTGSVYGIFDKPVHMWRGTTMAGIVTDESANNPKRGFTGGYEMETLSLGLPFMAAFLNPGAWGREFTSALAGYANMAGMWLVGEDVPQETNRVTLHPTEKDRFGMPIPNVHFDDHPNDVAMRAHAYRQGKPCYQAAVAKRPIRTPPYPTTHNPGTARKATTARHGACTRWR